MNKTEETKTEETDEILEKLKKKYPDVTKQVCVDCGELISYYDRDSCLDFDEEGNEASEPEVDYLGGDDYYTAIDSTDDGGTICRGCSESLQHHGSTMIIKTPTGDELSIKFNSTFYSDYDSFIERVEEFGISNDDVVALMQGRKYHKTDAWRGHYYSDPNKELWTGLNVDFAWLSGHHSNALVLEQKKLLEQAFKELEIPVFYCVHMSSNVFYQNIDAFVSAKHTDNANKIIGFINDFTGAKDSRWDAGILMHFDADKQLAEKLQEQLNSQKLPDDWSWTDFVEKYDEMVKTVKKFKTEGFAGMSFEQQVGVMAGSGETGLMMAQTMMAIRELKAKKENETNEPNESNPVS